ncbi:MAG: hypothetical protein E6Q24_01960 [Chitinophagaceae bacterium]|jgi:hypothetical protein|nr:hypothetical protein [Sphingobacteriales bacterium]OJW03732.1 MAG: hypothetical protein BGO52_16305 [Sphingobacteriales bacterium 44-61]TXJ29186.1 MAG: hypothetical protein E6Q24_01960 [Chitinophagaceae bacterium]
MKRIRIVQAVVLVAVAAVITSCSTTRYDYDPYPPPPPRTSVSLIVTAGPGMVINRYHDGRYYYRNPSGWIYWRGYDNRYYLDRKYIHKSYKRYPQYNDWNRGRGHGYGRRR